MVLDEEKENCTFKISVVYRNLDMIQAKRFEEVGVSVCKEIFQKLMRRSVLFQITPPSGSTIDLVKKGRRLVLLKHSLKRFSDLKLASWDPVRQNLTNK